MPDMKDSAATQAPSSFKQSLPDGSFGSEEGKDKMLPAPQHVDTVMYSEGETRPDNMRSSAEAGFSMRNYGEFAGRRGPMPRNASDELYLEGYGRNVADPRMSDDNAMAGPSPKAEPDKCDLYGDNRDGVLHNKNWIAGAIKHPGSYGHHSLKQIHRDEQKGGKIAKKAQLAETLRNLHK